MADRREATRRGSKDASRLSSLSGAKLREVVGVVRKSEALSSSRNGEAVSNDVAPTASDSEGIALSKRAEGSFEDAETAKPSRSKVKKWFGTLRWTPAGFAVMGLFRSSSVLGIAAETLDFVRSAAEETHPNEYMGLLRGEDASEFGLTESGTVITDVLVIPGTESNPVSATVKTSLVPNDMRAAGSIHSHPNGVLRPSDADRATFGKGEVHIILGAPYGLDDWRAFDREGDWRKLPVLDVELPDDEDFFDFTQEDIDEELR